MQFRYELINWLIKKHCYNKYLEIGVWKKETFKMIECSEKYSVDIEPKWTPDYIGSSSSFFKQNKIQYDLIFIDGDHTYNQCYEDLRNALLCISECGMVIMHDLLPRNWINQIPTRVYEPTNVTIRNWNGQAWRVFAWHRKHVRTLDMVTVNLDGGMGIIKRGYQELYEGKIDDFEDYKKDQKRMMNLIEVDDLIAEI